MKAMIFAAGKGTRLKPLTDNLPKALVKVHNIPLLEHVILKLKKSGVTEIIINVHYLSNQIIDFLKEKNNFDIRIEISDETDLLLDTGGGLKKAAWFFDDNKPFIVHNVDIISEINLEELYNYHVANNALATLAMSKRNSSRYFLMNTENQLCGWENTQTKVKIISKSANKLTQLAFSGIHVINPEIFSFFDKDQLFSITSMYLELSKKKIIKGYVHENKNWFDIGTKEKLQKAEIYLKTV